ncbi:hypothetical protein JCM10213v2_002599 [Rhodosporidiobolus nylandii]
MAPLKLPSVALPTSPRAALSPLWPPDGGSVRATSRRSLFGIVLSALAFFFLVHATLLRDRPPPVDPEEAWVEQRMRQRFRLFSSTPPLPRAVRGDKLSFTDYLDYHFPLSSAPSEVPHIWISLADIVFAKTGAAVMHNFVQQLNEEREAKYGGAKRETRLVVLCLDEECVEECDRRGIWAYGGFERTRPEQILKATWPKDPYPHMEPLMDEGFDLLAQENDALEHFNTGWMWLRKGEKLVEAWKEVLAMDMRETSRDQVNFNTVLSTAQLRLHDDGDPYQRPLKSNFTTESGIRVHVLDDRLFRTYHQRDQAHVSRHNSLYVHATCCDDAWVKLFVAMSEGFWNDLDGYYSRPPPLLSIDHLSGSQTDLKQLFRILLTAAHYTRRAITLPSHATILDLPLTSTSPVRASYSAFPLSQLAGAPSAGPIDVRILESGYVEHAMAHLLGVSALNASERRTDGWWESLGQVERERREAKVVELTRVAELDMRQTPTLSSLLTRLLNDPTFTSASHIRLMNFDWPDFQRWRDWALPATLDSVGTCARLAELPACDQVCRFDGPREFRVDERWPPLAELEVEQ